MSKITNDGLTWSSTRWCWFPQTILLSTLLCSYQPMHLIDAWDVIKVDYVCRGVCWMFSNYI